MRLQKWEQKVVESNVAEFEPGPPPGTTPAPAAQPPAQAPAAHQYNLAIPQPRATPSNYQTPGGSSANYGTPSTIKTESHDSPYSLPALPAPGPPQPGHRPIPALPGLPGLPGLPQPHYTPAQVQHAMQQSLTPQHLQALAAHHAHTQLQAARQQALSAQQQQSQQKPTAAQLQAAANRMPQVDGPSGFVATSEPIAIPRISKSIPQVDGPGSTSSSSSSRSSASPPPPSHTIPAPAASSSAPRAGDEEIGSDLDDDDSDADNEDGNPVAAADGAGTGDIVYCTYDKVIKPKTRRRRRLTHPDD